MNLHQLVITWPGQTLHHTSQLAVTEPAEELEILVLLCPWPRCCLSSSGSRGNMLAPHHSVLLSFSKEFSFTSRSPVQIQVRSVVIEITAVPALLRCT